VSAMLPAQFADLEAFAPRWCLGTEPERYRTRLGTSMEEMQAFYDAAAPRAEAAIAYLATLGLDELDGEDRNLLHLLYSLVQVSFPVEVWRQPRVPDTGSASFDCFTEPIP